MLIYFTIRWLQIYINSPSNHFIYKCYKIRIYEIRCMRLTVVNIHKKGELIIYKRMNM